jgi:ABC-type transporter Mla MlaB component
LAARESPTTSVRALRPPPEPHTINLVISNAIPRADIPGLCEWFQELLEGSDATLIVCDVGALDHPDAVVVDALARLQLTARRFGGRIGLRHACEDLQALVDFMGLDGLLQRCGGLPLESRRQSEEREQARGVQEEHDTGDPTT